MQISRGLFGLAVVGAFVWVAQSGPRRSTEPAKATTAPAKPTPDPSETFEARNPQHELHVDFNGGSAASTASR
jgi:hypothetical protein